MYAVYVMFVAVFPNLTVLITVRVDNVNRIS